MGHLPPIVRSIFSILASLVVGARSYGATSFFAVGMSSGGDIASSLACQPDSPFDGFGGVT